MKTYTPKIADIEAARQWFVVDAAGQTLGRLAARVAHRLRGKHKPIYAPHADAGDFIVVVNARQVVVTGRKEEQKVYHRHSGRPGSLRTENVRRLRARHPEKLIENAVRGMLPKNSLGRKMFRKLKVYSGPDHPHQAQQPTALEL